MADNFDLFDSIHAEDYETVVIFLTVDKFGQRFLELIRGIDADIAVLDVDHLYELTVA